MEPIASSTDQVDFEISADQAEASYGYHFDRTLQQTSTGSYVLTGSLRSDYDFTQDSGGGGHTLPVEPTPTPLREGTTSTMTGTGADEPTEPVPNTVEVELAPVNTGRTKDTGSPEVSEKAEFRNKSCSAVKKTT